MATLIRMRGRYRLPGPGGVWRPMGLVTGGDEAEVQFVVEAEYERRMAARASRVG